MADKVCMRVVGAADKEHKPAAVRHNPVAVRSHLAVDHSLGIHSDAVVHILPAAALHNLVYFTFKFNFHNPEVGSFYKKNSIYPPPYCEL